MRILLVNAYHYARGGAEVHALALESALRGAGHEVRFFGMHDPRDASTPDSAYWMPNIDFARLNESKSPRAAVQVLRRSIYSPEAARRVGAMVWDWRPDVAHLHNIHAHLTLSVPLELSRRGVPMVWTLHDYKLLCPNTSLAVRGAVCERCKPKRFLQCTVNRCKKGSLTASLAATLEAEASRFVDPWRRVDRFIAPSAFLMSKFGEFGRDTSAFTHIPNFAPDDLTPGSREPIPGRFVYAGRLDRTKGVGTLIEAIGRVSDCTLDVAGEGPQEAELRSLAERVASGRVTFHGRVDAVRLAALRDVALAAVVPSEWYENSPYAVTEAFLRWCPVIAADIGGLPELVSNDENGLLFRPGDSEGLAKALRRFRDDSELRAATSAGARATSRTLGVGDYVVRLESVYGEAMAARHRSG